MRYVALAIYVICAINANAQIDGRDSISEKIPFRKVFVVPSLLLGAGLVAFTDNEILDRSEFKEFRDERTPKFRTRIDDYLQFSPLAATAALKALGVNSEHDWTNMMLLMVKSEIIMIAIVFPTKTLTGVTRPDGGTHSFPSGHTAQAFAAATVLQKEFGKDHPLIGILGYVTASSVGILRILNDRHWASDVLTGAGVGILATNIAYLTHRGRFAKHSKLASNMTLTPSWSRGSFGLNAFFRLK